MVEERLENGRRIAQLLASEIDGRTDGELDSLSIREANPEVEPTVEGAFAYGFRVGEKSEKQRIASVYVHPDRAHIEFGTNHEAVIAAAESEGLRVRPKAVHPPKTLVFVEDGAQVKRAVSVIERAVQSN
jgi:hypothetical protein